jgi:hypothetical protein
MGSQAAPKKEQVVAAIREVRVLVAYRGRLLKLCKLAFSRSDASFYLLPYAKKGRYFYGGRTLPEREVQDTFDFTSQLSDDRVPN